MHLMICKIDAQSISGTGLNREELKTRKWSGIGPLLLAIAGTFLNFDDIFLDREDLVNYYFFLELSRI